MIDELLGGRGADRILVGVGPGSFTGIRVGIAAAQGLAIGWDCELAGMSSLALLAAGAGAARGRSPPRWTAAMANCSSSSSTGARSRRRRELLNLPPAEAAECIAADLVVGPAPALVEARGSRRSSRGSGLRAATLSGFPRAAHPCAQAGLRPGARRPAKEAA